MRATFLVVLGLVIAGLSSPVGAEPPKVRADRWENTEAFFPGTYYFRVGSENYGRGNVGTAIEMWKISARYAKKDAQFNLGLVYFKGETITADRPLGLAWLALAAERGDDRFKESLAAAWVEASAEERKRAESVWQILKSDYADSVAVPRAERAFRDEMNQITGSRLGSGSGHVTSNFANGTSSDMAWVVREAVRERKLYLDELTGSATVGAPVPIEDVPAPKH